MLTMSEKIRNAYVSVILFLVLNVQTCYGSYTCYPMSSGKDICFMLDASEQTFEESKQFCQNNGGFLLEIYNLEMQELVQQFGKHKTAYLGNAWLNLVRTTSNVWVWGGEGSDKILSYSNWDGVTPASYEGSLSHAFLNSVYKWINSYDPQKASTICIQGNSEPYWLGSETTSTVITTTPVISIPAVDNATTKITNVNTTVWSPKETESIPTADSTKIINVNTTTTTTTTTTTAAAESPKETVSVPTAESPTTYTCYQLPSGKDICFMLDASEQTFEESKQFCQNNGGFLLEIYNLEMQELVQQFGKHKTAYLGNAWLNLVRTTSSVWVWGGEGSDKILSYSNWDGVTPASYEGSLSHAFLNSVYKWINSYDPQKASTICIQGNSEPYWLGSETTSTVNTTTTVWSPKESESIPTPDSAKIANVNTTTTAAESPKEVASVPTAESPTTRTTIKKADSAKQITNSVTSSNNISEATTSTNTKLSQSTTKAFTLTTTTSNSDLESSSAAAGVGVGLGGLVLIIVSSLLIAKFHFDEEIPLPFNSSRRGNSPPHETGSNVINDGYEQLDGKTLDERSPHAEVVMNLRQTRLSTAMVSKT